MLEIEKPVVKCEKTSDDGQYGKFVVEPLERGYGNTLGNSLRRVLLSSLPGFAPTSIKIEGVLHEFSTIVGVREDVSEIILNVKKIVAKLHTEKSKTVYIEHEGAGIIKAGDLKCDLEVEIINKDLHIASLNEDAKLYAEIVFNKGRGYVTSEKNKLTLEPVIGLIPVDSIYTPVLKVSYTVENTRVENVTDYDKLIIEIWTNGSIDAQTAISLSAKIITEHMNLFIGLSSQEITGSKLIFENNEKESDKIFDVPIEELELSVRSYNCLKRAGINTLKNLTEKNEAEMMKIRNLGWKSLDEIVEKLNSLDLQFAE
ncbi:MAG: DNA-directed RNA polymerase subunit alpha [Clostridiales bacterium]|jgi:DNA-directed RNA polymerase subunit alpha|nr:DNA-directed RNA polymerase subunit alpha [Clostridiales bacterium]